MIIMDDIERGRRRQVIAQAHETCERLAGIEHRSEAGPFVDDPLERWAAGMPQPEPKPTERHTAATSQAPDWTGWESWLRARLDAERAFILQCVGQALGQALQKERTARRRELSDEVKRLRIELAAAGETIDGLRRAIAASNHSSGVGEVIDLPARRAN